MVAFFLGIMLMCGIFTLMAFDDPGGEAGPLMCGVTFVALVAAFLCHLAGW